MKGGIVVTEVRRLKADTEREAVASERTAKDPRPMATIEKSQKLLRNKQRQLIDIKAEMIQIST